jgi:hypothetical protein
MSRHWPEAERQREVAGWRASGLSAVEYASARGYSPGTLSRWARRATSTERKARVTAPKLVRLEVAAVVAVTPLVVEAGRGRVMVSAGFDAALLRAVVEALAGAAK